MRQSGEGSFFMSDTMVGVILLVLCLPILFVLAVFLVNETKPKKNIILGVTLPFFARDDAAVLRICAVFRKKIWICTICLLFLGIPVCFFPWFSVQLTLFLTWLIVVIFVPNFLFVRAHLQLKALKKEKKWFFQQYAAQTVVDISTMGKVRKPLSAWWFIPPIIISLVPVLLAAMQYRGEDLTGWFVFCGSMAAMVLLSWLCYPLIFRQKADVVDDDSKVNAALTNVRRVNWGRAWIYIAWTTSFFALFFWFYRESQIGILIFSCVYSFVLMVLCFYTEFSTRHAQETLTARSGRVQYVDEDEYWIWGMFYYNPNDRHLAVNDRVGMNMSFNMARPAGKIIMGICTLLVAAMPFLGVWMMAVEFSPRTVELTEGSCIVTHLTEQFSVRYEEIDSAELISKLPKYSRTVGMGLDSLCEGIYNISGYGNCEVTLDPRESPYLVMKTGEKTYIFNLETPQQTEECYHTLSQKTMAD